MNTIYHNILNENMTPCRKTNMFIFNLSENEAQVANDKLVSILYKTALEKYNYIDFGDIETSAGNITKFNGYSVIKDTLTLMRQLIINDKVKNFAHLDAIEGSVRYLENHIGQFTKGFADDQSLIKVIYNTTLYGILGATNLLMAIYIDFTKAVDQSMAVTVQMHKEKNVKDYILFKSLRDFNIACANGSMDAVFAGSEKSKKFIGATFAGAAIFIASVSVILPFIRNIIYTVYDVRMNVSELLSNQAELLRLNAITVEDGNGELKKDADKKKVAKKQKVMADKLDKISSRIVVKFKDNDAKAKKELSKKLDVSDFGNGYSDTFSGGFSSGDIL